LISQKISPEKSTSFPQIIGHLPTLHRPSADPASAICRPCIGHLPTLIGHLPTLIGHLPTRQNEIGKLIVNKT
jgi:hypothetical protein